jgi:hypothetical protein
MLELFAAHRPLWTASFELLAQLDHAPEVRRAVADAQERARSGLAALFHEQLMTCDRDWPAPIKPCISCADIGFVRSPRQGPGMALQVVPAIDQADLRMVAGLVARLTPTQQRVAVAVAEAFRDGWLNPDDWDRYWYRCDFNNDSVLRDALTWLVGR